MIQQAFIVNLTATGYKTAIVPMSEIKAELKDSNYSSIEDFNQNQYETRVFASEEQAEAWLNEYEDALETLSKKHKIRSKKTSKSKAALLYKRRYLALTLLGEKNQTFRNSERINKMMSKLKIGDCFKLHDQTHAIDVVLTKVTKVDDHTFKYDFKIAT